MQVFLCGLGDQTLQLDRIFMQKPQIYVSYSQDVAHSFAMVHRSFLA
jgi:hypothetical protein